MKELHTRVQGTGAHSQAGSQLHESHAQPFTVLLQLIMRPLAMVRLGRFGSVALESTGACPHDSC